MHYKCISQQQQKQKNGLPTTQVKHVCHSRLDALCKQDKHAKQQFPVNTKKSFWAEMSNHSSNLHGWKAKLMQKCKKDHLQAVSALGTCNECSLLTKLGKS